MIAELQARRLTNAKRLEARGYRLKSDADDPQFMHELDEARACDITSKLVAIGAIDWRDSLTQAARYAEDPQLAYLEAKRLAEHAEEVFAEVQALDAAEAQLELEARTAKEIEMYQLRARQAQARTALLDEASAKMEAKLKLMQDYETSRLHAEADAAVEQLIASGVVREFDNETIEDYRKTFLEDPSLIKMTLRLPVNRLRRFL